MSSDQRYYGAKRDTHDPRDYHKIYKLSTIPSKRIHPNVDLSMYVPLVYDQGPLNSCTSNAVCGAYALDLKKQSQNLKGYSYFDPSRLFLYYNTRKRENMVRHDSGASIRDTLKAMNCSGVCEETDWPYTAKKFKTRPTQTSYDKARGNDLKYERLKNDIDQLRACLKEGCPFVFGFEVYGSFERSRNGKIRMPTPAERRGECDGRHAVVGVGYDDTKKHMKVLNSWGSSWGDGGYFYLPYDFISDPHLCFDFWKITFAYEKSKPHTG